MAKICTDDCGRWYGGNNYLTDKQQKFNARAVARFCAALSKHEWSKKSIQALCGNLADESNINPQVYEDLKPMPPKTKNHGYGLVQWSPKQNLIDRTKKIKKYKSYDTMSTQLAVIDYEADHKLQWITTSRYPISFKEFIENKGNHSLEYLVGAWLCNYERPRDQSQEHIRKRTQQAEEVTSKIDWDDIMRDSIDDFLEWCKKIADDNEYIYIFGANHNAPPWTINPKGFDCSSFICYGLHEGGGYDLKKVFQTTKLKEGLEEIGFEAIRYTNKSKLKRGDVLVTERKRHTEAVYSIKNGDIKLVGAHDHYPTHPQDDIDIGNFYEDEWDWILRPFDSPSSKPRENPTNSNKSNRKVNPKTPNPITQNALPPTFIRRRRRGF